MIWISQIGVVDQEIVLWSLHMDSESHNSTRSEHILSHGAILRLLVEFLISGHTRAFHWSMDRRMMNNVCRTTGWCPSDLRFAGGIFFHYTMQTFPSIGRYCNRHHKWFLHWLNSCNNPSTLEVVTWGQFCSTQTSLLQTYIRDKMTISWQVFDQCWSCKRSPQGRVLVVVARWKYAIPALVSLVVYPRKACSHNLYQATVRGFWCHSCGKWWLSEWNLPNTGTVIRNRVPGTQLIDREFVVNDWLVVDCDGVRRCCSSLPPSPCSICHGLKRIWWQVVDSSSRECLTVWSC